MYNFSFLFLIFGVFFCSDSFLSNSIDCNSDFNDAFILSPTFESEGENTLPIHAMALLDTSLEVMQWKEGFLNKDLIPDLLVVMQSKKMNDPNQTDRFEGKRTLVILLADTSGKYNVFCENSRIVLCKKCGGPTGDPFAGIQIKGKEIYIKHSGGTAWKWEQQIVFKWNETKKTFLLMKDETKSFNAATPNAKKKVKTLGEGVVGQTIESFDIYVKR